MNYRTKVLLCAFALVCLGAHTRNYAHAETYPEDKFPYRVADDSIAQKIVPPKTALPIDDYIIALANARDANFIADVTSIPKKQTIQPNMLPILRGDMHWVISGSQIEGRAGEQFPDWY